MGCRNSKRRVCDRLPVNTKPSFKAYSNFSPRRATSVSLGRNRPDGGKACYSRDSGPVGRVLFNFLSGIQETRRPKASYEFEATQSVCEGAQIQDVHSSDNCTGITPRRLVGISRFKGRVLPYSDKTNSQKVSEVLFPRKAVPVLCSPLRSVYSSKGVHQNVSAPSGSAARKGNTSLPLHRRLSISSQDPSSVDSGGQYYNRSPVSSRLHDKRDEITPLTSPEVAISRHSMGLSPCNVLSSRESCYRIEGGSPGVYDTVSNQVSKTVQTVPRLNSSNTAGNTLCQVAHETYSNVLQFPLEGRGSTFGPSHCSTPNPYRPRSLVDRSFESDPGFRVAQSISDQGSDYGCLYSELGSPFEEQKSAGSLDTEPATLTYQRLGTTGDFQCIESLSSRCAGSVSVSPDGQHSCPLLHQQVGRNQVQRAVRFDVESHKLVHCSPDRSGSSPHSRGGECSGGHVVQTDSALPRVGVSQQGDPEAFPVLARPRDRSVRYLRQQEASQILLHPVLSRGRDSECSSPRLDTPLSVCISSSTTHPTSVSEGGERGSSNDINCSEVDQEGLVPDSPGSASGFPSETSSGQRPGNSAGRDAVPSQPSRVATRGLDDQRNKLLATGLSQAAAATILAATSKKTLQCYKSCWKHFTSWCESKDIDPYTSTLTMITNYLQHCLNIGLTYNTVRGRISAINSMHSVFGVRRTLSREPSIQKFRRGAFITHTPVRDKVPAWDLPLVLQALKGPPFEPLEHIDMDLLTIKTVFLLAICSAKRIGELQSLDSRPAFCAVSDAGVVLRTGPNFIPKVPSLQNVEQALEFAPFGKDVRNPIGTSRAICVCRALRVYLDRTKPIRRTTQLFVTFKQGGQGKPVRTPTIATWLKKAISMAHSLQGKDIEQGFKAHGVRGQSCSWAELKCANIMDICRQACWKSPNTFVKHYKLDLPASVSQRHGQLVLQAADD